MSQNRQLLDQIAARAKEIVNAQTAVVALAESEGEIVYYAAAVGKHAESILERRGAAATSGLCGVAFGGDQPVLVCQTQGDSRVRQDYVEALGIETALAVPLHYEGKLLGALMVLNRTDDCLFDQTAERVLAHYAQEVAPLVYQYQTASDEGKLREET
ncbi:MAG: hypothetical protein N4J56_002195 [Chroococcidiopsis sp. SAG 2025]|uniref:GAF domain-containing protein n=1 Tax=Chroococcidiopsis sp. SAG 2025 TaxID=171389 RepID=UPI0029371FFC|nr:GAF domain-containing protein [Chroococcidiopsis sp. SAG 2025]MDV2992541.1 hypothetical protein [Chroococcidiopsis sp. SAG 2025]